MTVRLLHSVSVERGYQNPSCKQMTGIKLDDVCQEPAPLQRLNRSQPFLPTQVSRFAGGFFTSRATREAQEPYVCAPPNELLTSL